MKILVDENQPAQVAALLRQLGEEVDEVAVVLYASVIDLDILEFARQHEYHALLTCDAEMRAEVAYRERFMEFIDVGVVIFLPHQFHNIQIHRKTEWLLEHWPNIRSVVEICPRGHFLDVSWTGLPRIRPYPTRRYSSGGP